MVSCQLSRATARILLILGAVLNTAKVEKGSRVAVFGMGAVGLAVIMVRSADTHTSVTSEGG